MEFHLIQIPRKYEAIILAVSHQEFIEKGISSYKKNSKSVVYDIKSVLPFDQIDKRL